MESLTIAELMQKLSALFPNSLAFTDAKVWMDEYQRVLGHLSPEHLGTAYRRTMDEWIKTSPPRPGDFFANAPKMSSQPARKWDDVKAVARGLQRSWEAKYPDVVRESENEGWAMELRDHIQKLAWMAAQYQNLGKSDWLTLTAAYFNRPGVAWLTDDDIAVFRGRIRSRLGVVGVPMPKMMAAE